MGQSSSRSSTATGRVKNDDNRSNNIVKTEGRKNRAYPIVGSNKIMAPKGHGTYSKPVQGNLLFGCDFKTADRICNYNRHYAEHSGYFRGGSRTFLSAAREAKKNGETITFYDSNTGKPLFTSPVNRSWDEWLKESKDHGWPSFRDEEVNWDHVRCLKNGECVSIHGTHLGHNLPDSKGNRYCINLVSIAGNKIDDKNDFGTIEEAKEEAPQRTA